MATERGQFTFYASFATALRRLKKKNERCAAYDAIINYALYEIEPDENELPNAAVIAFELIRPTLDASRRKALSGRLGGLSGERSKAEANGKQTGSKGKGKRENENEIEIESEIETEIENETETEIETETEGEKESETEGEEEKEPEGKSHPSIPKAPSAARREVLRRQEREREEQLRQLKRLGLEPARPPNPVSWQGNPGDSSDSALRMTEEGNPYTFLPIKLS